MKHDASEGHRLLREAYERNPDSLGPIQALSSFSRAHRDTWGSLRDRLPVQLGDVSEQVTSVFDAIDQDVAPLRSLLPPSPGDKRDDGKRRGDSATASGAPSAAEPSASPGTGRDGSGTGEAGSARPSGSADTEREKDGLLGGNTGGLLDPPQESGQSTTPPHDRLGHQASRPRRHAPTSPTRAAAGSGHRRGGPGVGLGAPPHRRGAPLVHVSSRPEEDRPSAQHPP